MTPGSLGASGLWFLVCGSWLDVLADSRVCRTGSAMVGAFVHGEDEAAARAEVSRRLLVAAADVRVLCRTGSGMDRKRLAHGID